MTSSKTENTSFFLRINSFCFEMLMKNKLLSSHKSVTNWILRGLLLGESRVDDDDVVLLDFDI